MSDLEKLFGLDTLPPPVDRSKQTLVDGSPVTPDHAEQGANGLQKAYVVLSEAERAKGFVRPVRNFYIHDRCGRLTRMHITLAETFARDPEFYTGTYCAHCQAHFPIGPEGEFSWSDREYDNDKVGT